MTDLPTGTVTFVFTDIQASTKLLQQLGADGYATALREHRDVVRNAFRAGHEVDTQGDGFFYVFARASEALEACATAVAGLDDAVRIRVGVHTGEPLLNEDGYIGVDVHRAARIAAAAHGGQIVLSQATRDLVPDTVAIDLGEHRLKDLTRPERLYQLGEGDFPPLKSLNRVNLPIAAWPLIGRERELGEVAGLLSRGTRLVTLTGPGGSGKTRLGLQVAVETIEKFPDGVFFTALAPIDDPTHVSSAIADAMGLPAGEDLFEAVASKRALILLDNAEHLELAGLVSELLDRGRELTLIVTSRAPLHLASERGFPVEPLAEAAAVELFVARAQAVGVRVESDSAVAAVCRRLDSLPLAVELAATHTKVLSPSALLERLDRALPLLTGGPRDVPERQQTLRATIEWSYRLLSEDIASAFRTLCVFRGGFTLKAAEAVAQIGIDAMSSLVDQSLVKPLGGGRFLILETLREYGLELLGASAELDRARARHASFFADAVVEWESVARGGDGATAASSYRADSANVWPMLDYLVETKQDARACSLASKLVGPWRWTGHVNEARGWLERVLADRDDVTSARAEALGIAAFLAGHQGDLKEAERYGTASLELARATDVPLLEIRALVALGIVQSRRSNFARSTELWREARKVALEVGDHARALWAAHDLAIDLVHLGQVDEARVIFDAALEDACGDGGSPRTKVSALINLAWADQVDGQFDAADAGIREALRMARAVGFDEATAAGLNVLAVNNLCRDQRAAALHVAVEAIGVAERVQLRLQLVESLEFAALALPDSEVQLAATVLAVVDEFRTTHGFAREPFHVRELAGHQQRVREAAGTTLAKPALRDVDAAAKALQRIEGLDVPDRRDPDREVRERQT